MKKTMTGKQALLESLKMEGIDHIFGNPGTSEAPFISMLGDYPEFRYILTLQESVAVGMAETYARSTGKASLVSLHVDNGLANGISLMLDAYNTGTPMVVTSANYDARKITEGKTDLAELVRPVTKWAVELNFPDQIPGAIRRAFNEANSHPKGPVYVGFSSNALESYADMEILSPSIIHDQTRPDFDGVKRAVEILTVSKYPIMLVGDRVSDDEAIEEAVRLAELMGLPVYQSRGAEVSFPTKHEQFFGNISLRLASDRSVIRRSDTVLAIGMDTFEELFYWGDKILNKDAKLIHIDSDVEKIGKSEPTTVGIPSNCKLALQELIESLENTISKTAIIDIENRRAEITKEVAAQKQAFHDSVSAKWDQIPITPARMMSEIADALPQNAIVIDDSLSNRSALRKYIHASRRGDIRGVRGQSIGGGIGATMGNQCASPEKKVFGIIGDGSAMMTIQGLWTAANDEIPCIFIICNNGMYRILKVNFDIYQREILGENETAGSKLPYSDFSLPFDIASIATSMGVRGERIVNPQQIKPAIQRAIASGKPALLDVIIDGTL